MPRKRDAIVSWLVGEDKYNLRVPYDHIVSVNEVPGGKYKVTLPNDDEFDETVIAVEYLGEEDSYLADELDNDYEEFLRYTNEGNVVFKDYSSVYLRILNTTESNDIRGEVRAFLNGILSRRGYPPSNLIEDSELTIDTSTLSGYVQVSLSNIRREKQWVLRDHGIKPWTMAPIREQPRSIYNTAGVYTVRVDSNTSNGIVIPNDPWL